MRYLLAAALLAALPAAAPADHRDRWSPSDALVYQWYSRFAPQHAAYLTDPGTTGKPQMLDRGASPQDVLTSIIASQEYWIRSGKTPDGFVRTLLQDLTGRPPARREAAFWEDRLINTVAGAPDYDELRDLTNTLLTRYPQTWQPEREVAPPDGPRRDYDRDRRDGDRDDDYDYRRPPHRPIRPDRP